MNIIFRRCLAMLNLTKIKRDYYDTEDETRQLRDKEMNGRE